MAYREMQYAIALEMKYKRFEIQPYPCTAIILTAILEFVIRFVLNFFN